MKVVLDTNIYVSGIFWKGVSNKILSFIFNCEIDLICSYDILAELRCVLLEFKIKLDETNVEEVLALIKSRSFMIYPFDTIDLIKEDITDNKFIEAAYYGGASFVITNDKHLLRYRCYKNILIVKPDVFLAYFEKTL